MRGNERECAGTRAGTCANGETVRTLEARWYGASPSVCFACTVVDSLAKGQTPSMGAAHWFRHTPLTYASVYNRAYRALHRPPAQTRAFHHDPCARALDAWMRRRLQTLLRSSLPLSVRVQFTAHVKTLLRTQAIGQKRLAPDTMHLLRVADGTNTFATLFRIRRLQHCILRYLWRPHGPLMRRHIPHDFIVTSTPDGAT